MGSLYKAITLKGEFHVFFFHHPWRYSPGCTQLPQWVKDPRLCGLNTPHGNPNIVSQSWQKFPNFASTAFYLKPNLKGPIQPSLTNLVTKRISALDGKRKHSIDSTTSIYRFLYTSIYPISFCNKKKLVITHLYSILLCIPFFLFIF